MPEESTIAWGAVSRGSSPPRVATAETPLRILISIRDPAHARFYRHAVAQLRGAGHLVCVCANSEEAGAVLAEYDLDHRVLGTRRHSKLGNLFERLGYDARLLIQMLRFEPDVVTSVGGMEIGRTAPLDTTKAVAFVHDRSLHPLLFPSRIDRVCTPRSFDGRFRCEHRSYESLPSASYLHPDRFDPSTAQLRRAGIDPDHKSCLICSSVSLEGENERDWPTWLDTELLDCISHVGTILLDSPGSIPTALKERVTEVPGSLRYDSLAVADYVLGDDPETVTVAALLGTPAVLVQTNAEIPDTVSAVASSGLLLVTEPPGTLETLRTQQRTRDPVDHGDRLVDVTSYIVEQLESLGQDARDEKWW